MGVEKILSPWNIQISWSEWSFIRPVFLYLIPVITHSDHSPSIHRFHEPITLSDQKVTCLKVTQFSNIPEIYLSCYMRYNIYNDHDFAAIFVQIITFKHCFYHTEKRINPISLQKIDVWDSKFPKKNRPKSDTFLGILLNPKCVTFWSDSVYI